MLVALRREKNLTVYKVRYNEPLYITLVKDGSVIDVLLSI